MGISTDRLQQNESVENGDVLCDAFGSIRMRASDSEVRYKALKHSKDASRNAVCSQKQRQYITSS